MTSALFALIAFGLGAWAWSSAQAAHQSARLHGMRACKDAGVQWLDQAVQLERVRLRRDRHGRMALERWYRFEYSRDGESRHAGRLILLGQQLTGLYGPSPEPPTT